MEFQGHRTNSIIVSEISGSKENNLLVNGISSSKQKEFTCKWNFKVKGKTVTFPMEFHGQRENSLLAN